MKVSYRIQALALAASGALLVAACSESPMKSGGSPVAPSGATSVTRQAEGNFFELCKDYSGTPGPAVTFNVSVDQDNNGSIDTTFQRTLSNGQCADIWSDVGTGRDIVTVTELVPTGYTASFVRTVLQQGVSTTDPRVTGATASGPVAHADVGTLVIFTNTFNEQPPPPPPDGEGCTPGYWKNSTGTWQGFTPSQNFDTVFGLGTPGLFTPDKTLLQALQLGGGGFNKLARMAVAALLNAAHSGVDFPQTTTQVINAVKAAFTSGNPEPLATNLDTLNNAGCPLSNDNAGGGN
jgi:hypothetical protein